MVRIDINKFLNNFGRSFHNPSTGSKATFNIHNQAFSVEQTRQPAISQTTQLQQSATNLGNLQSNLPAMSQTSTPVFAREILNFPKNVNEFVYMLQKGINQAQFNQMYANAQRSSLSQMQAQILAQLQGLDISVSKEIANAQLASQIQGSFKNLEILSNGMINLSQVALLIQKNGKEGITKLIMAMTEASKSGISDLSQLKEMAKLINASVSIAAENNPNKTLKLLLMLYLPWLPLEDNVGFDLEIQNKNPEKDDSDSLIVITVSTINYGIIKATIYLESSNSVQVCIECCDKFPKEELKLRLDGAQKSYSMNSVLTFESDKKLLNSLNAQSANINMSKTTEINPYLLLMAHSIVRHIIEIDNNKTNGLNSHTDKF